MKNRMRPDQRGAATLIIIMALIMASMIYITAALMIAANRYKMAGHVERRAMANYLALAGLRWGQWYVSGGNTLPSSEPADANMPPIDNSSIGVKVWQDGNEIHSKATY